MNMDEISLNMIANLKVAKPIYAETFLYATPVTTRKQLHLYKDKFVQNFNGKRKNSVIVTTHALERWNMRVGPVTTIQNLQGLLQTIIQLQPRRIQKMNDHVWCLDDDIVFVATWQQQQIHIITFLGRISYRPALKHVRDIQAYMQKERDRIDLMLTEQELAQAMLPIFPHMITYVAGDTTSYWLEQFSMAHEEKPIIFCWTYNAVLKKKESYWIDLQKPEERLLHRKVLNLLYRWGHHEFLRTYYEIYDQKQIAKIAERMRQKVRRREKRNDE